MESIKCPVCQSDNINKSGFKNNKQRIYCKDCKKLYTLGIKYELSDFDVKIALTCPMPRCNKSFEVKLKDVPKNHYVMCPHCDWHVKVPDYD